MKNIITLAIASIYFMQLSFAQAPSYTDFELDIVRLGYASPAGIENINGGVTFGGELRYNLKDNFSLGLSNQYATFNVKDIVRNESGDAASSLSIGLVGDYYLKTTSSRRAFIGLAFGFQRFGEYSFDINGVTEEKETEVGFYVSPRVGYEFGHLRILANYNLALKDVLPNYFSIGLGLTLWGGYNG